MKRAAFLRRHGIIADSDVPPCAVALHVVGGEPHDEAAFAVIFLLVPLARPGTTLKPSGFKSSILVGIGSVPLFVESEHHFSLRQNPFGWIQSALNRVSFLPRNGLYTLLHERPPGGGLPLDAPTRFLLRAALLIGAPFALALSVVEAACRSGATVHVVARRPAEDRAQVERTDGVIRQAPSLGAAEPRPISTGAFREES